MFDRVGPGIDRQADAVGAMRVDAGRYLVRHDGLEMLPITPVIKLPQIGILRLHSAQPSAALDSLLTLVRAEVSTLIDRRGAGPWRPGHLCRQLLQDPEQLVAGRFCPGGQRAAEAPGGGQDDQRPGLFEAGRGGIGHGRRVARAAALKPRSAAVHQYRCAGLKRTSLMP